MSNIAKMAELALFFFEIPPRSSNMRAEDTRDENKTEIVATKIVTLIFISTRSLNNVEDE